MGESKQISEDGGIGDKVISKPLDITVTTVGAINQTHKHILAINQPRPGASLNISKGEIFWQRSQKNIQ